MLYLLLIANVTEMILIKISRIFNPTSNFIILIISTLISLLLSITNPIIYVESLPWWKKLFYFLFQYTSLSDVKIIYIMLLVWSVWSIFYLIHSPLIENKDGEISKLIIENDKLKRNLESEAGLLLSRYSDLTKFKIRDVLQESLRRYIDSKKIIESAQLYRYSYNTQKEVTKIKVEFSGGYVKEGININSIMQTYYSVPSYVLDRFEKLVGLYKHLSEVKEESEELISSIFNTIDEIATGIINCLIENLSKKADIGFDDEDADVYTVLITTIALLFEDDSEDSEIASAYDNNKERIIKEIFKDSNAEQELRIKRRTGILESVLRKDYAVFQHDGPNDKNGRAYISKCISLNEEKYVLLISCNPYISEKNGWKNTLLDLVNELEEILNQCFETS